MNIWEALFLRRRIPFRAYYIRHINEVAENKYNIEYNSDYWKKTRTFIKASNLVKELFKQNFFKPIIFGEYHILNKVIYNEIDADVMNINLKYNKEYYSKIITI